MGKRARARIRWLPPDAGGRERPPTGSEGARYTTLSHFEDDVIYWPESQWSLVVQFEEPSSRTLETIATVWFLSSDAPHDFLRAGSHFELLEGKRIVARGEILD